MAASQSRAIVLYDGVCGLCNGLVQFLLKRDTHDRLRYASLQSEFAGAVLRRNGADPHDLDTVYVVVSHDQPNEKMLARSDAILFLAEQLGGVWGLATVGRVIPRAVRDAIYGLVARNRYRMFGKYETCVLPEPGHRNKFLDM